MILSNNTFCLSLYGFSLFLNSAAILLNTATTSSDRIGLPSGPNISSILKNGWTLNALLSTSTLFLTNSNAL